MYFNISIRNFWCKSKKLKSYFLFHKKITKFKHFELECVNDNYHIFCLEFKISHKEDHAGIRASVSFFGIEIYAHLYDIRHWDYLNDYWENK